MVANQTGEEYEDNSNSTMAPTFVNSAATARPTPPETSVSAQDMITVILSSIAITTLFLCSCYLYYYIEELVAMHRNVVNPEGAEEEEEGEEANNNNNDPNHAQEEEERRRRRAIIHVVGGGN